MVDLVGLVDVQERTIVFIHVETRCLLLCGDAWYIGNDDIPIARIMTFLMHHAHVIPIVQAMHHRCLAITIRRRKGFVHGIQNDQIVGIKHPGDDIGTKGDQCRNQGGENVA
jgi:hypothetical protein